MGPASIQGRLLFEEIWYTDSVIQYHFPGEVSTQQAFLIIIVQKNKLLYVAS